MSGCRHRVHSAYLQSQSLFHALQGLFRLQAHMLSCDKPHVIAVLCWILVPQSSRDKQPKNRIQPTSPKLYCALARVTYPGAQDGSALHRHVQLMYRMAGKPQQWRHFPCNMHRVRSVNNVGRVYVCKTYMVADVADCTAGQYCFTSSKTCTIPMFNVIIWPSPVF